MAIKRGQREIGNAQVSLNKILELTKSIESISERDVNDAMDFGAKEAQTTARKFAQTNLRGSGIKSRTGALRRQLANSELYFKSGGAGRAMVIFSMPSGKSEKDYKKAGSLNYGAIRTSKKDSSLANSIGAKRKQTIKKNIGKSTKGGSTKLALNILADTGSIYQTKSGSISGNTTVGKISVTKGFNFFQLKQGQQTKVTEIVLSSAVNFLQKLIERKVK